MAEFFLAPGKSIHKILNADEEKKLEGLLKKYSTDQHEFKDMKYFYENYIITDFIEYDKVTKDELFFLASILIKTVTTNGSSFFITPDHTKFISYVTQNILKPLSDFEREIDRIKLIGSILLVNSTSPPQLPYPLNNILQTICSFYGPTIASYVAFPFLEFICKYISPYLNVDGKLISLPSTRKHVPYKDKISSIKEIFYITEVSFPSELKSLFIHLDEKVDLYDRVKTHRDNLLHGRISHTWESYTLFLLLVLIYISKNNFPNQ